MRLHAAKYFALDDDQAQAFSAYLRQLNFPHRLSEHRQQLCLWVYQPELISQVETLFERYQQDPINPLSAEPAAQSSRLSAKFLLHYPLTLWFLLLMALGSVLIPFEYLTALSQLSFQGLRLQQSPLGVNEVAEVYAQIRGGQIWRLFTPIFLHFDALHFVFNAVFFWFFASQCERLQGRLSLLSSIGLLALISNGLQFMTHPAHLFGGMSGVNYGLMGYCWLTNKLGEKPLFNVPDGLLTVSVIMILLGFAGAFSLFGYSIANWAHLSGFLGGLLLALWRRIF